MKTYDEIMEMTSVEMLDVIKSDELQKLIKTLDDSQLNKLNVKMGTQVLQDTKTMMDDQREIIDSQHAVIELLKEELASLRGTVQ